MRQKILKDVPITKKVLEDVLDKKLKNYMTKQDLERTLDDKLNNYATKQDLDDKLQNHPTKTEFQQFRSDIMSRFDDLIGKFDQMREVLLLMNYDINILRKGYALHERRLTKLEK